MNRTLLAITTGAILLAACSDSDDDTAPADDSANPNVPIVPGDDPMSSGGGAPTLTLANRETVLADVLRVLNAEVIDETLGARPDLPGTDADAPAGLTRIGTTDDVTDEPPAVPVPAVPSGADVPGTAEAFRRVDYRCDAGGTVTVLVERMESGSPVSDVFSIYDACTFDGRTLDGATRTRDLAVRPPLSGTGAAGFSVTTPDGRVRTLDGVTERAPNSAVTANDLLELRGIAYTEESATGVLRVADHDARLRAEIDDIPGGDVTEALLPDGRVAEFFEVTLDVALEGGFDIDAPWSGGESARVAFALEGEDSFSRWPGWTPEASNDEFGELVAPDGTPLAFDVEPDARFSWDSGTLTITAADGSVLAIEPVDEGEAGIDGPAFAVTAGDERTVVPQDEIPIACVERIGDVCLLGTDTTP